MFESRDFYMGLTGAEMEQDLFDLGGGLSLQKTYAHLMKPLIMAFAPAVNGVSNPGPWKSLYEGSGYDIRMELHVSEAYLDADTFGLGKLVIDDGFLRRFDQGHRRLELGRLAGQFGVAVILRE